MFDIQNYPSFVIAVLVFRLMPGAGTIAILNATASDGNAAGMAAVAGTLAAITLHATVLSLAYQAMLVLAGNAAARRLASILSARRIATRLGGAALIGLGIKLAAGNR